MTFDHFSELASGIESLVIAAAVLLGGAWTLIRFSALKAIRKAKAELEAVERGLMQRGILDIDIVASNLHQQDLALHRLLVKVKVKNIGDRTEVLVWDTVSIKAIPVDTPRLADEPPSESGKGQSVHNAAQNLDNTSESILPGQTRIFPFVISLHAPGLYLIAFDALVSPRESELLGQEHPKFPGELDEVFWQGSTYHMVPARSN